MESLDRFGHFICQPAFGNVGSDVDVLVPLVIAWPLYALNGYLFTGKWTLRTLILIAIRC